MRHAGPGSASALASPAPLRPARSPSSSASRRSRLSRRDPPARPAGRPVNDTAASPSRASCAPAGHVQSDRPHQRWRAVSGCHRGVRSRSPTAAARPGVSDESGRRALVRAAGPPHARADRGRHGTRCARGSRRRRHDRVVAADTARDERLGQRRRPATVAPRRPRAGRARPTAHPVPAGEQDPVEVVEARLGDRRPEQRELRHHVLPNPNHRSRSRACYPAPHDPRNRQRAEI